ncbi:hypothetical protein HDV00_002323 [Rhizophlyctis rosea]|nr:hypothetical protein HDV00_002323 [Rhizophlyctis rosea]
MRAHTFLLLAPFLLSPTIAQQNQTTEPFYGNFTLQACDALDFKCGSGFPKQCPFKATTPKLEMCKLPKDGPGFALCDCRNKKDTSLQAPLTEGMFVNARCTAQCFSYGCSGVTIRSCVANPNQTISVHCQFNCGRLDDVFDGIPNPGNTDIKLNLTSNPAAGTKNGGTMLGAGVGSSLVAAFAGLLWIAL